MADLPSLLAVDADGYAWRVYDHGWSMARINPDNSPVPRPVTFYEPVAEDPRLPYEEVAAELPAEHHDAFWAAVAKAKVRQLRRQAGLPSVHNLPAADRG